MKIIKPLIFVHPTTSVEKKGNERGSSRSAPAAKSFIITKKYKIELVKHAARPYSRMLVSVLESVQKEKKHDFMAEVTFLSSYSGLDIVEEEQEDVESIKENELADVMGKYPFSKFRIRGKSRIVMDITINKDQELKHTYTDFMAEVTFLSSYSGLDIVEEEQEDVESIKEDDLADIANRYRTFVQCIKTTEQRELSRRSKNTFRTINLSTFQRIKKGLNGNQIRKSMISNGTYIKKASVTTVNIKKVISQFKELKNDPIRREIYTKINVGGMPVTIASTIELDADIVTVIQNEPEVKNFAIRNFILSVHMSNISLSTFFLLNRVNQIFSSCWMVIGFGRLATTPFSTFNTGVLLSSPDPIALLTTLAPALVMPTLSIALPAGLFIFIPRIARIMIKHYVRKKVLVSKSNSFRE